MRWNEINLLKPLSDLLERNQIKVVLYDTHKDPERALVPRDAALILRCISLAFLQLFGQVFFLLLT